MCECLCVCLLVHVCVCVCRSYLWGPVEGVGVENGLYHDERLGQVLTHELVSVV